VKREHKLRETKPSRANDKFSLAQISKDSHIRFVGGDKQQLMDMIIICSELNVPLPRWVTQALQAVRVSEFKSWDEVFGKPTRMIKRRNRKRMHLAWLEVRRLRKQGLPIDEALFQKAAENLQIGRTGSSTVRNLYYEFERDRKSVTEGHC
jgi:hypothetical protein